MGMQQVDLVLPHCPAKAPRHRPVHSRPSPQVDYLISFRRKLIAQGSNPVEAEEHEAEVSRKAAGHFRGEHLGAAVRQAVQDVTDRYRWIA